MNKLNFQEIILRLLDFWKGQGCLVQQPHNVQVGAGTMNPATILRVLGPEPWNVVYVEPSVRPDDGRYGNNPNRMQLHHQLQVILKPDPGNPQELYLESLEAIGIAPEYHDIRFVEDNWESPALGAWGLGWEVWLDGQEITQFTYFQQSGGKNLDTVAVEITYGLDRIALALQGVSGVWELEYGANIPYGDLLLQSEIEQCRYYFEIADIEAIRSVYDIYEREAGRCIDAGLVTPAHDYNLKCSHLFNVMDARGAVGVTERANYFRRMRQVASQVSDLYLEQRQRLEYPFLDAWPENEASRVEPGLQLAQIRQPHTFLLEIGTEELPVHDISTAVKQLEVRVPELLAELRVSHGEVVLFGTPRRLALVVHEMAGRQDDLEEIAKGPPADRAFDADGKPTRAAIGFARSKGVDAADLKTIEEGNKRYAAAVVRQEGRPSAVVLAERLPGLIGGLRFERSMRWNSSNVYFSRPLRWMVALYGPDVVRFEYAGIQSARLSRGLRPKGSPAIEIDDASNYMSTMRRHGIVISVSKRQYLIMDVATKLAAEKGGMIPDDEALLAEVANLVERPTPLRGRFDQRFLKLPDEVLVAVMRKHQRYFPVYAQNGRLLPYFIAVRNGDERHLDGVVAGNEHVIGARFSDAEFFYGKDSDRGLSQFQADLEALTFQNDLGSMLDKVHRLQKLTPSIARMLDLTEEETLVANRATTLSKADLTSDMVIEMTSLQGIMGGHYARLAGESNEVAAAIAEQYNAVSATRPGLALALADRLDSLVALFAAGLAPKGSNDPFALRRAALNVIENLIANEVEFDLRVGLEAAANLQTVACDERTVEAVLAFIRGRSETWLRDDGHSASVVKSVLAEQAHNPFAAQRTAVLLSEATRSEEWPDLLDAFARCVRITRSLDEMLELEPDRLTEDAEQTLLAAYRSAVELTDGTLAPFLAALRKMMPAINRFFDEILVMDEDQVTRENRLALLQKLAALTQGIADLSHLEGF
jgi:glycyl-tRNA synthetase